MKVAWNQWRNSLRVYREPATLRMFFFGFSSGLPLLLVFGTLNFWLREAGIELKTIGFLSWVGLAYAFKWVWAPLVDRAPLPGLTRRLGRRRAWLLLAQLGVMAGLVSMAFTDPQQHLYALVGCALFTAFASATQDIALDAYRIESAQLEKQAALAAAYQTGYRLAMIWAGAGVLAIAARFDANEATYELAPWTAAYLVMAASMLVGIFTTWFSPEPAATHTPLPATKNWANLRETVWQPFADFFQRFGWQALLILALIATYRLSDVVMGVMANPFYRDLGFSKDEVAAVSKVYGVVMTLLGAVLGGVLTLRWGVLRVLLLGAFLSAATNLLFAALALQGHNLMFLMLAVSADNLSAGLASAAFIAYLSGLTNVAYSATQYALFSSVMLLLPKFLAGFSGWMVDSWGYATFFVMTALLGIPVLLLISLLIRAKLTPPSST